MKRCTKCREIKSVSEFYANSRTKDGLMVWCKLCRTTANAERKAADPARFREIARRSEIKSLYSITWDDYLKLVELQSGACAICQRKPGKTRLRVDHDHSCCPGKKSCGNCIRGLLCNDCNHLLLGRICRESQQGGDFAIEVLYRAIRYIRQTDAQVMAI